MANPVEQFTAPGKYELDLFFEKIDSEMKDNRELYIGIRNSHYYRDKLFKNNPYYTFSKASNKIINEN